MWGLLQSDWWVTEMRVFTSKTPSISMLDEFWMCLACISKRLHWWIHIFLLFSCIHKLRCGFINISLIYINRIQYLIIKRKLLLLRWKVALCFQVTDNFREYRFIRKNKTKLKLVHYLIKPLQRLCLLRSCLKLKENWNNISSMIAIIGCSASKPFWKIKHSPIITMRTEKKIQARLTLFVLLDTRAVD